jgi:Zn-dependent M16 (insulinase) family peptidase
VRPRRGELMLEIYRSPNAYLAWEEARNIVREIVDGKVFSCLGVG